MSKNTNSVAQSTATRRRSALIVLAGAAVLIAMILAVVTRSSNNATGARHHGVVDVLYAGSLSDLMQLQIAPAFHRATGYTVQGFSGGSTALATEIKNGIEVGDVFLSASAMADAALAGSANGSWVSSYTQFGTSKLLLAYNPDSSFALALRSTPWYEVVDRGGFHLGRTDPLTDPKGVLAVSALKTAANFLRYVDGKFYDGGVVDRAVRRDNTTRHDVEIEVIQFQINPASQAETFPPIPLERTSVTGLTHQDGAISMSRGGADTATASFFVAIGDQHELDFGVFLSGAVEI